MKRKPFFAVFGALFLASSLLLVSCSGGRSTAPADPDAPLALGKRLTIQAPDHGLKLLDAKDALSADGLYYASWAIGQPEPYENADGDTVDLYDAQLYLLTAECSDADTAGEKTAAWLTAAQDSYQISDTQTVTCAGQEYTVITYTFPNKDNPYTHGVSAFGLSDSAGTAVCAEFTCRESFTGDPGTILTDFLGGLTFSAE